MRGPSVCKLFFLFGILVFLPILFSGCSQAQQGVTELTFMTFETGRVNVAFYKGLFKEFEKVHPDISIRLMDIPYGGYNSKILTMTAGGTAPDIFVIGSSTIVDYAQKGVLLNLKPFLERSKVLNEGDFFSQAINAFKFNGKIVGKGNIYGLPKDWSCDNMLFYNKDMFDKAGLAYPDGNWQGGDLLKAAIKLTKKDAKGHVIQYGLEPFWSWPLIYQYGGALFSKDLKRCVVDSPQAVEALKFWLALSNKYHVTQTFSEAKNQSRLFEMGRAAMKFGARYNYAIDRKTISSFRWGVAPPVRWKGKKITTIGAVFGYAISSKTKHPQAAWELVEFMVGPTGQKKSARIGYNIPTLRAIAYSKYFLNNPEQPAGLNKLFVDEMKYAVMFQVSPYITPGEFFSIYTRERDLASMGNQSIEETVKKIVKQVNEQIANNIDRAR